MHTGEKMRAIFTDDFYTNMMKQTKDGFSSGNDNAKQNTSADAKAIAEAIMMAGAFVAQAIDASIGPEYMNEGLDRGGCLADRVHDLSIEINEALKG